jgi:hypothetical protein
MLTAQGQDMLAMETAALWKQWKNQTTVFPLLPQRLENSTNNVAFPTVPTATAASYQS